MLPQADIDARAMIRTVLRAGTVRVALQPIVDAATRRVAFHECLIRPTSHNGEELEPGDFIETAERLGFDHAVDRTVAGRAVELLGQTPDLRLSINVSGQTTGDLTFVDDLLQSAGSDLTVLSRLIVEITETAPIAGLRQAKTFIERLHEFGARVAIDDFGAGHTSFETLRQLPVDIVKIDGRFIQNIASAGAGRNLVEAVLKFASERRLETVAEWVETAADADLLRDRGVTYLQGRQFGMPELVA